MKKQIILFSLLFLLACSKPLPELANIDTTRWKNDRNGCKGDRISMKEAINSQKDKLLALEEMQIVKLLGRPDHNELYDRNQKFYYYFITPSSSCEHPDSTTIRLEIRFTAMGIANEVFVK